MSDMNFNMNAFQNMPLNNTLNSVDKMNETTPAAEVNAIISAARSKAGEHLLKPDRPENQVLSFIDRSMESLSEANKKLREHAQKMAEASERLGDAFDRNPQTGDLDKQRANKAALEFVDRYNELVDSIKNSGNGTVEGKARFLGDMTDAYSRRLEKVGITKGEDNRLTFDETQLSQATERDIERVFGKEDSFAEFVDGQAKQLASYAQTDLYQRSEAYNDAGSIMQISNISGSYFNMLG